jgi:hypothetical protein
MDQSLLFEEKQYIGYNKSSIFRRTVLAVFCFLAYYWSFFRGINGDLLFVVGISILVISGLLLFVLHLHTKVYPESIIMDGLWTAKKVKVDFKSIVSVEKVPYSNFYLNNPVYNLHRKGTIHFYTGGNEAVRLTDKDGQIYLIGSQKAAELAKTINGIIEKNSGTLS